ncbi:hypothetical protein [Haloechinothrix salitolerans]|uniref:Uncharacterized protein n=1 Tax=Haloechinothrix salitolerans TaxID=926830 RepID=A0ABW2C1R1_9PSEU
MTEPTEPTEQGRPDEPDGPSDETRRARRWAWIASALAATVALVATVVIVLALRGDDDKGGVATEPTTTPPTTSVTTTTTTTSSEPVPAFGYQPLWPFASVADAAEWQRAYREGGHQPWHLDAEFTARQFAQSYLGYDNIDRVVSTRIRGDEAWVGVGFELPNGEDTTAAVVHLAKVGGGADAPWEIVGTKDTTLTLTSPPYGASVTSPVTVGGSITGVDENLRVTVWQLGTGKIAESDGIPAGGQNSRWSTKVSFTAPSGSVLTIAVATGGHVAEVERFAITGVRVGG